MDNMFCLSISSKYSASALWPRTELAPLLDAAPVVNPRIQESLLNEILYGLLVIFTFMALSIGDDSSSSLSLVKISLTWFSYGVITRHLKLFLVVALCSISMHMVSVFSLLLLYHYNDIMDRPFLPISHGFPMTFGLSLIYGKYIEKHNYVI